MAKNDRQALAFFVEPRLAIFNVYSLIAAIYCSAFAYIYFWIVGSDLLGWVHLIGFIWVVLNWVLTRVTRNIQLGINLILADGTMVVSFLFATGGWDGSGYIWVFAYLPYAAFLTSMIGGLLWMGALFTICFCLAMAKYAGLIPFPYYSGDQLINFFAAFVVFSACIYFFQAALISYRRLALGKQIELQNKNSQLSEAEQKLHLNYEVLSQSLHDLKKQKEEIEKMNRFMIDREVKMAELKRENRELKKGN